MKTSIWVVLGLLAAGAAVGLFGARFFLKSATEPAGLSSVVPPAPPPPPSSLPNLEDSDGLAREKGGALTADAAAREWLKQDSLIARLTAAISRAGHGEVARDVLAAFAPRGKFRVKKKDGRVLVDPSGYARYDEIGVLANSVDADAAAKTFTFLLPLFDAAQRALGEPNASARESLFGAARELLSAPVLEEDLALKTGKKGIGWAYADDRLEKLSPARKQLLRLGPANEKAVQAKLRAIAVALGATDLPKP